jgi:hypothetical protein
MVAGKEGPIQGVAKTMFLHDNVGYTYGVPGVARGMESSYNPKDSARRTK